MVRVLDFNSCLASGVLSSMPTGLTHSLPFKGGANGERDLRRGRQGPVAFPRPACP